MIQSQGLTKLSKTDLILAEQDKGQTIKLIAYMLHRLSRLYQLGNWTEDNAVFLAEWIYDNYKYDSLDDIIICLRNPPSTENKQWRLTPDTIREWMKIILIKRAEQRELENKKLKETFKDKLEVIDYEAFKTKIETHGLPGEKERPHDDQYENFRMKYLIDKQQKEVPNETENANQPETNNLNQD
jgi:hypothetical protein